MKITTNFQLQEFIHPEIYKMTGDRSADFLHPFLAPTMQSLRDFFGPIIVNDWMWGGTFKDSGLRTPNSIIGSLFSSHRFGAGADDKFSDAEPIEVQNYIVKHPDKFPLITRIENARVTKTWLHVEVGKRINLIKVFNP